MPARPHCMAVAARGVSAQASALESVVIADLGTGLTARSAELADRIIASRGFARRDSKARARRPGDTERSRSV